MRQPLQVIVIPYRVVDDQLEFAIFHRASGSMWHFVSGGAEDEETPLQTARRELQEETGIGAGVTLFQLDSIASVPRTAFSGTDHWPADLYVVPEYSFAVDVGTRDIHLSEEHDRYAWLNFTRAHLTLTWDSNKVALWELNQRLRRGGDL